MLADLTAQRRAVDERAGFRRRRADRRHLRAEWIKAQPGMVYFGPGESVTLMQRKVKYVAGWAPYWPYTAGELARLYLDGLIREQLHDKRISDHWKITPRDEELLAIPAPLYFKPGITDAERNGRFVYIDIAACYFELMKGWPLNIGFTPGGENGYSDPRSTSKPGDAGHGAQGAIQRGVARNGHAAKPRPHSAAGLELQSADGRCCGEGSNSLPPGTRTDPGGGSLRDLFLGTAGRIAWPRPELRIPESDWGWLRREKPLRHAIFGMLAAPEIGWYRNGVYEHHKTLGNYGAPDLVALVKTQLHRIAREAVEEFGALMWLTDAGIFEASSRSVTGTQQDGERGQPEPTRSGRPESVHAGRFAKWSQQGTHPFQAHLASLGLSSSIKAQGAGHLYAMGDYRIGRMRSRMGHVDLPGWNNLGLT